MSCRIARLLCAVVLLCTTSAIAQERSDVARVASAAPQGSSAAVPESSDPPAHVSFVDGAAVLERDGRPDAAPLNMPLLAGDRIRTEAGRAEILFVDGSTLHLDAYTTLDFQSDELVRLLDGRIRLMIPGPERQVRYRIDAPSASVEIDGPGEYRVSILRGAREPEVELAVLRGFAELVNDEGRTPLRAGQRAYSRGTAAPSDAYAFNSAAWDAFDRWSEGRRDQRLGVSTQYLPDEVRPYAASFDRDGSWQYEASYGYVWYPRVSVGWRPYYNGRWVTLRPYGWTWVGADPWAWPTHHYGRWGISAGVWFWIPGRSWAPAWVSWAYAPGYVSWCPLGWNNRAVVQIAYGHGYDPWRAWTAVPNRHFGRGFDVRRVTTRNFDVRTREAFVRRETAPDIRGFAVPRSSAPIRIAGTAAGFRSSSPVYTNLEPGASRVAAGASRTVVGSSSSRVGGPIRSDQAGAGADPRRAVPRADGVPGSDRGNMNRDGTFRAGAASVIQPRSRDRVPAGAVGQERSGILERVPGATAVRRGATAPAPQPSTERSRATPYYGQYGVQPRAVPRDNPVYRPMPAPAERGMPADRGISAAPRAFQAPASQPMEARPRYGSDNYTPQAPERRAPERAPDSGARAVPRAAPGAARPAPESRQAPGADGGSRAADRSAGAPSGGGRSRSGGRGR
jgi:hypothetical protein